MKMESEKAYRRTKIGTRLERSFALRHVKVNKNTSGRVFVFIVIEKNIVM